MRAEFMPPEMAQDPHIQDAHRMVQCNAAPESMWVQHHNGIFRSTDHGATWNELTGIQPSVFGFGVAAHPTDANTAWFAPAQKDECRVPVDGSVVVTRTQDGGKSFETLKQGLPQEHAYHLIYRHCLEVDETGRRLAMGSTTGGLWISEDGGEGWQTVSRDLPPVFCVRFR